MSIERWGMPQEHPHTPAKYDENVVMAARAIATGTANDGQQKDFLEYIQFVCGVGKYQDLSYRPGDQMATAFAQGKAFAGLQIMKLLHPLTLEAAQLKTKAQPKARSKGK